MFRNPVGRASKAASIGAKTVKGPPRTTVEVILITNHNYMLAIDKTAYDSYEFSESLFRYRINQILQRDVSYHLNLDYWITP